MFIEFLICWYSLSVGFICYQESKVGWPIVPYKKIIPFLWYHMVLATIQLLYILPLWCFMTKRSHQRFTWNQISLNFRTLLPIWWGPIKWKGLHNVSNRQSIWVGNHQSIIDTAIMTLLPCHTDIVGTSNESIKYLACGGLMSFMCGTILVKRGSPNVREDFYNNCIDVLSDGLSINIFPQGISKHIYTGVLPVKNTTFYIAHELSVPLQPYTIVYKLGRGIVVTIHPIVEVVGRSIENTMGEVDMIFS
jgi:1-acyl-sn-glycerol-3-phosphate acyltransferase